MKILLTTSAAPQKSPFYTGEKRPPLGVGSLISVLRKKGHQVYFIDNYLAPSRFIEEGFLQKNNIDFMGIYANTICYQETLKMLEKIQDLRNNHLWNGKIIVGGPHTSVALETIPKYVDYIVQGEGEIAIQKIVDNKANSRVIKEERIKNLDSLPFQPWDIFTEMPYDYTCQWMDIKPVFTLNTSRGCPFNCSFCSVGSIWGREYTFFSADRIIDEIKYLTDNFGARGIYFREDNFTLNIKRTKDFCKKMIDEKIDIHWACETRVDNMNEDIIKLMSDAGCRAVYLGIESGSEEILKTLNKNISTKQIRQTIPLFKKYGINTYCSLITGIPGETYDDYLSTLNLMKEVKPFEYSFGVFVGIPYSPLYTQILNNHLYEYMDKSGLLYLPGYDIKTKYFYNSDSSNFVDYRFKERTDYDLELIAEMKKAKTPRLIERLKNSIKSKLAQI